MACYTVIDLLFSNHFIDVESNNVSITMSAYSNTISFTFHNITVMIVYLSCIVSLWFKHATTLPLSTTKITNIDKLCKIMNDIVCCSIINFMVNVLHFQILVENICETNKAKQKNG